MQITGNDLILLEVKVEKGHGCNGGISMGNFVYQFNWMVQNAVKTKFALISWFIKKYKIDVTEFGIYIHIFAVLWLEVG